MTVCAMCKTKSELTSAIGLCSRCAKQAASGATMGDWARLRSMINEIEALALTRDRVVTHKLLAIIDKYKEG